MSNLPTKWKREQIAELLSKQFAGEWGQAPSSAQGNAYVLRATDLDKNGHLNYETAANRQIASKVLCQKKLLLGDIILEAAGGGPGTPVGHVGYFNASASKNYVASNFFRTLRPRPSVKPKFLWWRLCLLVSEPCIWRYQQQTTGIINLRFVDYLRHTLDIPENKNEQTAIAGILDTVDESIRQTAAVIEKLKKIKAGLLHDLLTRGIDENGQLGHSQSAKEHVPLSQMASINPPNDLSRLQDSSLVSFVPMQDVSETGHWIQRQTRTVRSVRAGFTVFQENDVLFAKITPCMENGKGMHAQGLTNGFGFASTEFHVLRARGNNSPRFIFWCTMYPRLRQLAAARMTGSAGQQRVPKVFFDWFTVPGFDPEEQNIIAMRLDAMENRLQAESASLRKLTMVKQGLMQDLLQGRVRVPVDIAAAQEQEPVAADKGKKEANIYFKRSVLAAEIVNQMHKSPTFGHVKFMKTLYLVEQLAHVALEGHYHRAAAGPLDNHMIRSVDNQMKKQKWFRAVPRDTAGGKPGGYTYEAMEKAGGHREWFEKYWEGARAKIQAVIDLLQRLDTQQCEIIATLYSAWADRLSAGQTVTDDAIITEVLTNWHESKQAITRDRWAKALGWMRKKELVPIMGGGE